MLHRPTSLREALALKAELGEAATFHAGGTELLVALKAHVLQYDHVIDIKQVQELREIRLLDDGALRIGSLSTHHVIAHDPLVQRLLPGYADLSDHVANIRVRVAGTLGGVLCFAEPHADAPTMLCALDARIVLANTTGQRNVPSREFHVGEFATARKDDELLVSIDVPPQLPGDRSAYRPFGHTERPAVGVAAVWSPQGSQRLRLWTGAVVAVPVALCKAQEVAQSLPSQAPFDEVWRALEPVITAEAEQIDAHDDLHGSADYKKHLVTVLAQRALQECLQ
ncbi:FAD binding domain-containing protein [Variovorax sp. SRS16]|uniref:FAD binding domain-containing protein n=1 Tax=Variovorax sp. SRS16 TaxID=282217 RepID=UPI0013A5402F|nr:FAD binding domain-containing protein [Variovorax sp. SRS16]